MPISGVRSLSVNQWPEADRAAWQEACRPNVRLKRGGAARLMSAVLPMISLAAVAFRDN